VQRDPESGDITGPVALGAAVSAAAEAPPAPAPPAEGQPPAEDAPKPEARLAVIGDSDFVSNGMLGFQGNRDFFLNAANWLALQENLIAIRPKAPDDRRITVTEDQHSRIRMISLFLIPGLLFAAGVRTWWRRR
jgi:ABC-type uncharacterized transport system involved in gliding motility auxiliary subunit